jgi:hypothetical protein
VSEIWALEANVSGRVAMEGSGVWAGLAASEDALTKGFEVEKGFNFAPEVENGFAVEVLELDPPNSWAPILVCCGAGAGAEFEDLVEDCV